MLKLLTGPTRWGLSADHRELLDLAEPTEPASAATKSYVDAHAGSGGAAIDDTIADTAPSASLVTRSAAKIGALLASAVASCTRFAIDRAALASALPGLPCYLGEGKRGGWFDHYTAAAFATAFGSTVAAATAADPRQGVYVADGSGGAWARRYTGAVSVGWFGLAGDGVTDDSPAFQAAADFFALVGGAIFVPDGFYRLASQIKFKAAPHFFGNLVFQDGTGGGGGNGAYKGATLYFDDAVGGFLAYYVTNLDGAGSPAIYPGCGGAIFENFRLLSASNGAARPGIYGFESRSECILNNVEIRGFGDHGVVIRGSTSGGDGVVYGNVNNSLLVRVRSVENGGAGFRISGNDANSINMIGCHGQANTGWGLDNDSFQGITTLGFIAEGNIAGAIITRRPLSSANTHIGADTEGATSILGPSDTVVGGGLSEIDSGQTNGFHGLLHANDATQLDGNLTAGTSAANSHVFNGTVTSWNGIDIRSGSSLRLIDAAGDLGISIFNDGANLSLGVINTVPVSAFAYKIGATTVINSGGVLQASAVPAFAGGDVTSLGGSLTLSIGANKVTRGMLAQTTAAALLGSTAAGNVTDLTAAQAKTVLAITAADVSGLAAVATSASASDLTAGTLAAARMPAHTGDVTSAAGNVALTIAANAVTFAKFVAATAAGVVGASAAGNFAQLGLAGGLGVSGGNLTLNGAITAATSIAIAGGITSTGGGIGYATGAGGAVAQATSKSTGVTLNKLCGQITMNAAALASNTGVSFVVTDSQVGATDTIDLVLASGNATAGTYNYQVDKVSAGSFVIWVKNISGGSLSEALVFNFSVKKAVAA